MARSTPAWGTPEWVDEYIARHGFPPLGGAQDPDPDPEPDPEPDPGKGPDPDPDPDPDPGRVSPDDDWKVKSRKNETRAKKAEREAAELRARLEKLEGASQSEHEKAVNEAYERGKTETLTEAEKERRHDRLEVASTRLAAKGFDVGEGDSAQAVKFADPDDALIYVERAIRAGDLDEADIFDDDGRVQTQALQEALADILENKPHLRSSDNGRPKGNPDTRRGNPADRDLEAMTPEDHARRKYGAKQ